jgi:hypothetical protein
MSAILVLVEIVLQGYPVRQYVCLGTRTELEQIDGPTNYHSNTVRTIHSQLHSCAHTKRASVLAGTNRVTRTNIPPTQIDRQPGWKQGSASQSTEKQQWREQAFAVGNRKHTNTFSVQIWRLNCI